MALALAVYTVGWLGRETVHHVLQRGFILAGCWYNGAGVRW